MKLERLRVGPVLEMLKQAQGHIWREQGRARKAPIGQSEDAYLSFGASILSFQLHRSVLK